MNEQTFGIKKGDLFIDKSCWFQNGMYSAVFNDNSALILYGDKFTYYNSKGVQSQLLTRHPINTDHIKSKLFKALENYNLHCHKVITHPDMHHSIYPIVSLTESVKFAYWNSEPIILQDGSISLSSTNGNCTIELSHNYLQFTAKFVNYEGKEPYWADANKLEKEKSTSTQTLKLFYEHSIITQTFGITCYPYYFAYPLYVIWQTLTVIPAIIPQHFDNIQYVKITANEARTDLPSQIPQINSIWDSKLLSPMDDLFNIQSNPLYAQYADSTIVMGENGEAQILLNSTYSLITSNKGKFIKKYIKNDGELSQEMSLSEGYYGTSDIKLAIAMAIELCRVAGIYNKKEKNKTIYRDVKIVKDISNQNGSFTLYSNGLVRAKFVDGCIAKYVCGGNIVELITGYGEIKVHRDHPSGFEIYITYLDDFLNECRDPHELESEKAQKEYESALIEWEMKKLEVAQVMCEGTENITSEEPEIKIPEDLDMANMTVEELLAKSNETLAYLSDVIAKTEG